MISRLITIILAVLLCGSVAHAQQGIRWSQQQLAATGSKDISYILQSLNTALETTSKGNETRWHNPATGSYGVIIPLSHTVKVIPLSKIEKTCRVYHRTRVSDGQTMAYEGMACREPDGWWQISEERQVPLTSVARAPKPTTQTEPPTIRSSQELTAETQTLLTQLGYNPGPVDGIFGSKTKSSIQAFQRQQGLPEDGRVSQVLVARLQEAVTVSAPTSTQQQNAAKQELINALEELDWAITDKINHDVQTIAQAFSDAYDIERSRRLADFVNAPLTVIEQAIGVRAFFKNFAEIISNIGRAESVLEVASLLMGIAQLQEVGENFQLALDGPAYSSLVDAMLEEAATSSVPGEYATTVKLHIGGIGGKKSPVGVRAPLSQRSSGLVWGTRTVKRLIKKQIAQFVEQLSGEELAASDVIAPILVHLTDVIRAIKKSRIANVAVLAGGPNTPRFDSIRLGSVGALEHVRSVALDAYDKNMQMLQSVVITSAIKAGSQAVTLSVAYKTPMGKLIGQAEREVFTPVSVYQTTLSKTYETNARDSVNGLPHEMLLALPAELSNTWTIIDDTLNSIRNALKTRDQLAAEREEVPPPAAEPRAAEEFFLGRVPTDSTMENGGWIGVRGKGVKVVHVTDGGPADKAGVREGDRIQSFRGVRVFEGRELKRLIAETPIGKTVPVVVSRTGETTTLYVTVASRPTETAATTDKLHSVDVTGFDVLGLKLYMTPDQVMHVLRSKNPKARISMGKTLCANEEREYIMTGAGYPKPKGTCVSWIHFAQRGKVGEYTINTGFIEDFPNNLSQSFVIYITYEFSPSLKRDSSKATKVAVIKKYGKPSWIQPYARGEEFPAVIWWGKLKRDWRKINREWECWVGNVPQPRSNVKTWGTDRCGMLPGGMPIDQNQASLRFGGSGVFIVYLSDRDLESRMYRAKKEYIKSKPVSTTVPKF